MTAIEFVLKTDLLPIINKLAEGQGNSLSPWSKGEVASEVDTNSWQRLEEEGLSDAPGKLKEDIATVIDELSQPVRMLRLRLTSSGAAMEHMIYYCKGGTEAISLTAKDDSLRFRAPAPIELIFDGFLEYWGGSGLVSSGLKTRLVPGEAMVLAAMMDLRRRQILSSLGAMGTSSEASIYSADEVKSALELNNRDAQWLVATMKTLTGIETEMPSLEKIEKTLESLVQKKLLERSEEGFVLIDDALALANNLLLISQILRLELFILEGDYIAGSSMLCLQAGLHDILYIDQEDGKIILEAVSSQMISEMVATFLSEEYRAAEKDEKDNMPQEDPQKAEDTGAAAWFLLQQDQQYGPYSWEDLQGYLAEGRLSGEELVWHEGLTEWTQLSQVNN